MAFGDKTMHPGCDRGLGLVGRRYLSQHRATAPVKPPRRCRNNDDLGKFRKLYAMRGMLVTADAKGPARARGKRVQSQACRARIVAQVQHAEGTCPCQRGSKPRIGTFERADADNQRQINHRGAPVRASKIGELLPIAESVRVVAGRIMVVAPV